MIRLLKMDFYRVFTSRRFWLSVLGTGAILLFSVSHIFVYYDQQYIDLCFMFAFSTSEAVNFVILMGVLPMIPYGAAYAMDRQSRAVPYYQIRSGFLPYIVSKYIVAVISGMLVFGLGMFFFLLALSLFYPLDSGCLMTGDGYSQLLENGHAFLYLFCGTLHYMFSAGILTAMGFAFSLLVPDVFTVLAFPMVLYFVLARMTENIPGLPTKLEFGALIQLIWYSESPAETMFLKAAPSMGFFALLLLIVILVGRRRCR